MQIRTVIVEGAAVSLDLLRTRMAGDPDFEIVAECRSGPAVLNAAHGAKPELIITDARPPMLSAFAVLRQLSNKPEPAVVVVTDDAADAVRALDLGVAAVLHKPHSEARFTAMLQRVKAYIMRQRQNRPSDEQSRSGALVYQYADRLLASDGRQMAVLPVSSIDVLESVGNYVRVHTRLRSYLTRATISSMEGRLDPTTFVRIHRSLIVNIRRIASLAHIENGVYRVFLRNGRELRMSRSFSGRFLATFFSYSTADGTLIEPDRESA